VRFFVPAELPTLFGAFPERAAHDQTVITGSFNFTKAAEDNTAENLLVIQDADMAAKYAPDGISRSDQHRLLPSKTRRTHPY
jgi:phosphatidylserine/phosphatidylglycerophosphate/cardiolipin synthase-like enzyme